jgi:hypothetical protein
MPESRAVSAVLHGGPADGRVVEVQVAAGYPPLYIGVARANYARPRGLVASDVDGGLCYRWVPPGGDPHDGTVTDLFG